MTADRSPVETLIYRLGYANSPNLIYYQDITNQMFSFHIHKVLMELEPFAVYAIDGKPFVLFFSLSDSNVIRKLNKKIWNSQIPLAIFCTDATVEIFNGTSLDLKSFLLNKVHEEPLSNCSESSPFSYWEITDSRFWGNYTSQYSSTTLNELLLKNIESLTGQLKKTYKISFATKLVLRLIFIRFLIDRGVNLDYEGFTSNVQQSQAEFLKIVKSKDQLYGLFAHLKRQFNGNLFDLDNEVENLSLNLNTFDLLHRFLSGKERLEDGQLMLFMMYDFNIIPVELISNIYEIMLGKEAQKEDKAFYTPHYLVDYIIKQSVVPYLHNHEKFTVLDPACGSGIFLVECYRKLIEANINKIDDDLLKNLLVDNIFGVDLNKDAIDITIFSLYLTMLDYKDPKTLVSFKLPNLKDKNLFYSDFFNDESLASLRNQSFDFIIGNPPWGKVSKGKHIDYCKCEKLPQQNDEISRSFVYKVKEYCNRNTVCCLVLPSKLLYNKESGAVKCRELLLTNTQITNIIELSSVRRLVFKNAKAPAIVLMFKYTDANNLNHKITYVSLKPNIFFKLFHIIVIEKNDIKYIEQKLLKDYDWAWKTIVYGSSWDFDIIKNLKDSYKTISKVISEQSPKMIAQSGIQANPGKQDASFLKDYDILNSTDGVTHFHVNNITKETFTLTNIHRTRNPKLFEPPYCLCQKWANTQNYKMRAAYSETKYVFKETIYGIKGNISQKNLLLALTGVFNSSFYAYLNFMLGSSMGIEREQRFMRKEVLEFPFPNSLLDEISVTTQHIQYLKSQLYLGVQNDIDDEVYHLDQIVLESFNLQNNTFFDYVQEIMIPQIANATKPDKLDYQEVTSVNMHLYSQYFLSYFENIYGAQDKFVQIKVYPKIARKYSAFELFICDGPVKQKIIDVLDSDDIKDFLSQQSIYQYNDLFYQIRDVLYFEENSFFIIKTNEYKNWHPAMAQIDLAEVIDRILSNDGGN